MTKILLVEDDKSLREIYGVRLLAEGYDIVSAGDGEEALAMAIKERPNLIVSDVMMPKISGFDMLDILRSTTETRGIKVIMMTALSSEEQRRRGEVLGADRYLVKSQVGIEDVVRTVHEVLEDGDLTVEQRTAQKHAPAYIPAKEVVATQYQEVQTPIEPQPHFATPQPEAQASVQNFEKAAPTPARAAQSMQSPVRTTMPSLAQFERERSASNFAASQPVQPVSRPVQLNQPKVATVPVRNFEAPKQSAIEAPTRPISDFVNQPQTTTQAQHPVATTAHRERVVQPVENNRSDEEILSSQINDILKSGINEDLLNNNPQQPPFGA
ncbi:response regulator [Candidatus Saccharibacteria bacterium]|nr:response regulator [Candidatus Saccharibacteria bacterium]